MFSRQLSSTAPTAIACRHDLIAGGRFWRRFTDPGRNPISRGTEGSNPFPSSGESAANRFLPRGGAERQRKTSWSVRFELTEQTRQAVPVLGPSRYPARKATPRTTHHGQRYKRAVRGLHAVGDPEHAEKSFVQELGYLVSARRQNVEMRIEASAVTEWTSGCRDSRRR